MQSHMGYHGLAWAIGQVCLDRFVIAWLRSDTGTHHFDQEAPASRRYQDTAFVGAC
jgi:hypothetical protein